jgi:phospholipid/cholesterol/gamma-HCH transport system substrate-binding protein
MTVPLNSSRNPPYKAVGLVFLVICVIVLVLVYMQFRGAFLSTTKLTMLAARAGLSMEPGAKVTYNGVQVGRIKAIQEVMGNGGPQAKFTLDMDQKYIRLIPANVNANIQASTVFGSKYVSLTAPEHPTAQRISSSDVIDATSATTESNTLFEAILSIAEKVDPVKLNVTLSAAAEALSGLGDKFGQSIVNGADILADLNPKMPQVRYDAQRLGDLGDTYANASPDLWDFLHNAVSTSRTIGSQLPDLDEVLTAALGFANAAGDNLSRGAPFAVRSLHDLQAMAGVLNKYSPEVFCLFRNWHDLAPVAAAANGGNGYSLNAITKLLGAANPYVYPDNLPRLHGTGGPNGKPGCWAPITRDLWPAPQLVLDTGASNVPYNHIGLGQPMFVEYVWGRQLGEYTINP